LESKSLEFKNKEDKRPIKLFFQDEARFGRIDNIVSCWVPSGNRALVGNQIIREYTYLYGAFCPETGESFLLILPYANKDCMEVFINMMSEQFIDYRIIMAMDNASWHNSNIEIENIVPLFQPPRSPEVNPAEHIWEYIRENEGFKNRTFNTLEEVEINLCKAAEKLLIDKERVKSLTGFDWVLKAI
jgi:transposase